MELGVGVAGNPTYAHANGQTLEDKSDASSSSSEVLILPELCKAYSELEAIHAASTSMLIITTEHRFLSSS